MPCTDGNLKIWNVVPDGARLHLSVVDIGEDGNVAPPGSQPFTAIARVLEHPSGEQVWQDATIRPGPRSTVLHAPDNCAILVSLAFAGKGRAQIRSWIDKDGVEGGENTHASPYCFPVSGIKDTLVTATIMAVTKKS